MSLTRMDVIMMLALAGAVGAASLIVQSLAPAWTVPVVAGASVAAVLLVLFDLYRRLLGMLHESHHAPGQNYRQIEALFSLFSLVRVEHPLPAMRGPAVSPDFACDLVSLIREIRPACVLEAGSGVSTLLAGYALKASGRGRLISIEEDAGFAEITRRRVADHGLQSCVTVVHAPLKTVRAGAHEHLWYDTEVLKDLPEVDLFIVDGPRQENLPARHLRYPALPLLFPRLSRGAAVLVDDCHRADEREIVERWLREFTGFEAERTWGEKRHTILRRRHQVS